MRERERERVYRQSEDKIQIVLGEEGSAALYVSACHRLRTETETVNINYPQSIAAFNFGFNLIL